MELTRYEALLDEAAKRGLIVREKPLQCSAGRICGNRIAIKEDLTQTEKADALEEEIAHYDLTVGNILSLTDENARKQEYKARKLAYSRSIGKAGIKRAIKHGCRTYYDAAEYLGVTEGVLREAAGYSGGA